MGVHGGTFKAQRQRQRREAARDGKGAGGAGRGGGLLFMRADTVAAWVGAKYGVRQDELMDPSRSDLASRLALGEAHCLQETKKGLASAGVDVDALFPIRGDGEGRGERGGERGGRGGDVKSSCVLLVKNLPHQTTEADLHALFGRFGTVVRIALPETRTVAVVVMASSSDAAHALKGTAWKRFHAVPLYVERAPPNAWPNPSLSKAAEKGKRGGEGEGKGEGEGDGEGGKGRATVFIKSLNFNTTEGDLHRHLASLLGGRGVRSCTIAMGASGSRGFGFAECLDHATALRLVKAGPTSLDGHALHLALAGKREDGEGEEGEGKGGK